MAEPARHPRRTFGPVVALELVAGGLAAYAAGKPWVTGEGADSAPGMATTTWGEVASSPLGTALGLVALACVGVVLVTRGRFRRAVTWLAVVVALGYAATVVWAPSSLPDHLREQVRTRTGAELESTSLTGWFWLAAAAAVLLLVSTALAVRLVRSWPEMGTRYDAPTSARDDAAVPRQPTENIDIWKALDEGRDPTA
ncbi:Trp biosynthesis-associated membrane protein [Nocardioides xinjiangensis]|uniref:Trp biosynthesis-associated membrane protein n=1 Tax=Nocardioides xinjiangensis TaxID=2817376 RepID=UPI001B3066AD|nr:Trp biosynthesis-associated membrane protein [Nocardioides sp. SYSU D00778]